MPRVPSNLSRVPSNLSRVPGNLPRVPGNLSRVPGDLSRVPGDLSRVPGDLPRVPSNVFTLVASEPTDDPSAWEFYCTTADRHVTIDFPQTLPVGTQVYVTAFWYSPRGESSPAAAAVGSRINYSVELAPSLKLKQAA